MAKGTIKLHVLIEREAMLRLLPVVASEFDGNVSKYIRTIIFTDLVRRKLLTNSEQKILES